MQLLLFNLHLIFLLLLKLNMVLLLLQFNLLLYFQPSVLLQLFLLSYTLPLPPCHPRNFLLPASPLTLSGMRCPCALPRSSSRWRSSRSPRPTGRRLRLSGCLPGIGEGWKGKAGRGRRMMRVRGTIQGWGWTSKLKRNLVCHKMILKKMEHKVYDQSSQNMVKPAVTDPSQSNSINRQNPPLQLNGRYFWNTDPILMPFGV